MSEDNFHLHLTQKQEDSCFLVQDSQQDSESFSQSQPSAGRLLSTLPALSRPNLSEMGSEEREKEVKEQAPGPDAEPQGEDVGDAGVTDSEEDVQDEESNHSQQNVPQLVSADSDSAIASSLSLIPPSVSHLNAENIIPSSLNPTNHDSHDDSEAGYSDASTAVVASDGPKSSPAPVSDQSEANPAQTSTSALSSLSSVSENDAKAMTPKRKRGRPATSRSNVKRRKANTSDEKSTTTTTETELSDQEIPKSTGLITSPSKKIGILSLSGQPMIIPDSQMSGIVPSSQMEVPYLIPSSPSELPPGGNDPMTQEFMLHMSVSQNQYFTMEDGSEKQSSKSLSLEKTSSSTEAAEPVGIFDALQQETLEETPCTNERTVIENPKVRNFRLEKPPLPENYEEMKESSEKSIFKSARQKAMSPKKSASKSSESLDKEPSTDPFDDVCLDKNKNECLKTPTKRVERSDHNIDLIHEDVQIPGCSKDVISKVTSSKTLQKPVTRVRDNEGETPKSRPTGKRGRTFLEMKSQASSSSSSCDEKRNDPYEFKSTQSQKEDTTKHSEVAQKGERSFHTTKITTVIKRVVILVEERLNGRCVNTKFDEMQEVIRSDLVTNDDFMTPSPSRSSATISSGDLGDISSIEHSSGSKNPSSGTSGEGSTVILRHSTSTASKSSVPSTPHVHDISKTPEEFPVEDSTFVKPAIPRKRSSFGSPNKSKSSKSTESFRRSSSLFSTMSEQDLLKNISPENQSKSSKSSDSTRRSASLFSNFSEHDLQPAIESLTMDETVMEKEKKGEETSTIELKDIEVAPPQLPEGPLAEGTTVFAMWKNKSFYPGKIKSKLGRDRYTVQYEDGAVKQVKDADLIICDLLPKGHDLMMEQEGDWVVRATVIGHEKIENGETVHVVEREASDRVIQRHQVPRTQVSLYPDQATQLRDAIKKTTENFVQETPMQTSEAPQESTTEGGVIPLSLPYLPKQALKIGESVFARWRGRNFYPGSVSVCHPDRLYTVAFADGSVREVHERDLIVCSMLPAGQNVMVLTGAEWAEEAVILGYCTVKLGRGYLVQFQDSSEREISCEDVYLSKDQAPCLLNDIKPGIRTVFDDVSLDNLVEGKRKRVGTPQTPKAKKGKNPSTRKKGQKLTDPKATSTPSRIDALKLTVEDDNKRTPYASPKPTERTKHRTQLFPDARGTVPTPDSTLFEGMVFLLSHVDKGEEQIREEKAMLANISANADESSSITEEDPIPFDKDHLCMQLTAGGGRVIDKFDMHEVLEVMSADLCLLISDSHQRSLKYFYSLACGVPCVSHVWVRDSCKMDKQLPYKSYILPAGVSCTRKCLVEWHARHNILRLMTVCVSSKNAKFVETWSSVLEVAGCVVRDSTINFEPGFVNFVLADQTIDSAVKTAVTDLEIPIVSSEWVIQCLINGQRLPYNAHEKFEHDYA